MPNPTENLAVPYFHPFLGCELRNILVFWKEKTDGNRVCILLSKTVIQPIRVRVLSELFYKRASLLLFLFVRNNKMTLALNDPYVSNVIISM